MTNIQMTVITVVVILGIVYVYFKNTRTTAITAKRITIGGLWGELHLVEAKKTQVNLVGIVSRSEDCLYVVYEDGKFEVEYEAMDADQIPYIEQLKDYAATHGLATHMTTYGGKPNYASEKPAPVLRIETHMSLDEVSDLVEKIEREVFGNNDQTQYELIP